MIRIASMVFFLGLAACNGSKAGSTDAGTDGSAVTLTDGGITCGAGTVLVGTTCVAAASTGACTASDGCGSGTVCSMTSGTCITPTCGKATGGSGSSTGPCTAAFACAADRVCVPTSQAIGADGSKKPSGSGVCAILCDPCAPSCPGGTSCVVDADGAGVCLPKLSMPGQPCADATQHVCALGLGCFGGACVPACNPSDAAFRAKTDFTDVAGVASTSADCATDSVCVLDALTTGGNVFSCIPGTITTEGAPCDELFTFCPYPFACRLVPDQLATSGVCSRVDCSSDPCDSTTSTCETVIDSSSNTHHVCIRPGTMPPGAYCSADADCVATLSCTTFGSNMQKTCK